MKSLACPDALISSHSDGTFRWGSYHISLSDSPGPWDLGQDDEFFWAIWKRWNDMKKLFSLYLDPKISQKYRDCPRVLLPAAVHLEESPCAMELDSQKICLNLDEAMGLDKIDLASYCRFYRALTAHWRASSLYHMAQTLDDFHPPDYGPLRYVSAARPFLEHKNTTLEEVLEIVEVIEFIWGFLGYTIFGLPQEPDAELNIDVMRHHRLMRFTAFLQPSDFLTILYDYRGASDDKLHEYVHQAASFAGERVKRIYSAFYHRTVELGICDALEKHPASPFSGRMGSGTAFQNLWKICSSEWDNFRSEWAAEIKGNVFNTESSFREMDFFAKIMGNAIKSLLHEEIS